MNRSPALPPFGRRSPRRTRNWRRRCWPMPRPMPPPNAASTTAPAVSSKRSARKSGGFGGIDDFLHAYSLSTKEGLALMVLAEALLRVPDAATADRLIEDKLAAGRWLDSDIRSTALLVSASAWTLGDRCAHHPSRRDAGDDPRQRRAAARPAGDAHGDAAGDAANRLAFRPRPDHRRGARPRRAATASSAIPSTCSAKARALRADAEKYLPLMPRRSPPSGPKPATPPCPNGPAFRSSSRRCIRAIEAISRVRVLAELAPRVIELARLAKATICNSPSTPRRPTGSNCRSKSSPACSPMPRCAGWDGFGLAVQAYQKRALAVIDWVEPRRRRSTAG